MNNIHESGELNHESFRPCPVCERRQAASLHHQRFVLPEQHLLAGGMTVQLGWLIWKRPSWRTFCDKERDIGQTSGWPGSHVRRDAL